MAGSEYQMIFKLSAQLGKEFGSTFSGAQKTMAATQKEIQALARTQGDIAAYEKQQKAVEATSRKLEDLQKEYNNIQREIEETGGFSSELENKLIEKQRAIDKTSESLENQTGKLNEMQEELRESGVDTEHLGEEEEKLKKKMEDLTEQQKKFGEESEESGEKGAGAFKMIGEALIAAGIEQGLQKIVTYFVEATMEAGQFADNVNTLSEKYGVATDDLQVFMYATDLLDVSVESLNASIARNVKSMYSAADGTGSAAEAYAKLGVDIVDSNGNLRDSTTVYWEVIDALGAMTNESERDGIAMSLLGKSAMELNPLINAGSAGMQQYAEEARKAGYVLSGDVLKALNKLDDTEVKQKNTITALKNEIGGQLAPAMTLWKQIQIEVLQGVLQFVKAHPNFTRGLVAIAAAGLALVKVYLAYKAVKLAMIAIKKLNNVLNGEETAGIFSLIAAKISETVVTEGATAAQIALNMAMYAFPGMAIIGVVGALVGAFAGLGSSVESSTDAFKDYDKIVASVHTPDLSTESSSSKGSFDNDALVGNNKILSRFKEITKTEESIKQHSEEIFALVQNLNEEYTDLNLTFDKTALSFNYPLDMIDKVIIASRNISHGSQAFTEYYGYLKEEAKYLNEYNALSSEYEEKLEQADEEWKKISIRLLKNAGFSFNNGVVDYGDKSQEYVDDFYKEYNAKRDEFYSDINSLNEKAGEAYTSYIENRNKAEAMVLPGGEIDVANATASINVYIDAIHELGVAYEEAYNSAYESISGQLKLWDTAPVVVEKSVSDVITALQTQEAYWADYKADLDFLTSKTGEIEGLSEMIATFADGSPESVNMIRGMANATDEELAEMVTSWQNVKTQQEEASKSLADVKTDFQNELNELTDAAKDAVDKMNLGEDAAKSAKETIDAYIEGLKSGNGALESWANHVKNVVRGAYISGLDSEGQARAREWGGYASGTDNAPPGLAWVGEEGPELVMFRGGEQVLTAKESLEFMRNARSAGSEINAYASGVGEYTEVVMLLPLLERAIEAVRAAETPISAAQNGSGRQVFITISPSFSVVSNDGNIETTLRDYADELKDEIFDALDEAGVDARRGAYR